MLGLLEVRNMSKSKVNKYLPSQHADLRKRIDENLALLELEGIREGCFEKLAEANIESHATPLEYLDALLDKQMAWKEEKRLHSWVQQARLGERKTLKDFNFSYQPTLDERLIRELASGRFIDEGRNVIFLGQSGVGKTHLAKAIGEEAIMHGYDLRFVEMKHFIPDFVEKRMESSTQRTLLKSLENPRLLILDDIRNEKVPKEVKSFLYRLISNRYDKKRSIIFTSNELFEEWGKLFGEYAGPLMDRIIHHARIIVIEGNSYRIPTDIKMDTMN